MIKLSNEQILILHSQLIKQTDGIDGVRDYSLLDSAIETPFQSYEEILEIAAGTQYYKDLLQWILDHQN